MTTTNETERLAALQRYHILDTEPERAFDDLAMLASHICGTPMALITMVDADRQWFKSRIGITPSRNVADDFVLRLCHPAARPLHHP